MATIVRDKNGQTIAIEADGTRRPANESDYKSLTITNPKIVNQSEQGVTNPERFTVKNFTNPASAKNYLRSIGYELADFGTGFNFAVRKPGDEEWKVLDPPGVNSVGEFFKDMTDLTADALGGLITAGATTAGAVGGLPGAIAAGAGSSAAVEAGRQGIGSLLGGENNFDPTQIAEMGAVGAAFPIAEAGLGAAGRGIASAVGKIGSELPTQAQKFGARIVGLKDFPNFDAGEILRTRAAVKPGEVLTHPLEVANLIRGKLKHIAENGFDELNQSRAILDKAAKAGVKAEIGTPIREFLALKPKSTIQDVQASVQASHIMSQIEEMLGLKDIGVLRTKGSIRLRVDKVDDIKRSLQALAELRGGYDGKPIKGPFVKKAKESAAKIRESLEHTLGTDYANLNAKTSEKLGIRDRVAKLVRGEGAEGNLLATYNKGRTIREKYLQDFDKAFSTNTDKLDFATIMRKSFAGYQFEASPGKSFGRPGFMPRFTATGQFLGPSLAGGAFGGLANRDDPVRGALLGASAGFGLASRRAVVGITRFLSKETPGASAFVSALRTLGRKATNAQLPMAVRATAMASLREGVARMQKERLIPEDRPVARMDAKRRELEGK